MTRRIRPDCIRRPRPDSITPRDYVPADSSPRSVSRGDSFYSIGKEMGVSPWAIIYYNFPGVGDRPTRRAAQEMNWYLQEYLGCSRLTRDGKNYLFHEEMSRPFIYLPNTRHDFDGTIVKGIRPSWAWFGFGLKQSFPSGLVDTQVREESHAMLVSWDNHEDKFAVTVRGTRHGLQVGAPTGTAGLSAFVATGLQIPRKLNGHEVTGLDFSLQLGPVGKALKGASLAWKLGKVAKPVAKGAITLAHWEKTRETFKQLIRAYNIDMNTTTPKLHVLDLPLSLGLIEASVYYLKATATVDWTNLKVARVLPPPGDLAEIP